MNARMAVSGGLMAVVLLLGGCARSSGGNAPAAAMGEPSRQPAGDSARGGMMGAGGMMGGGGMGGGMMGGPADTAAAPPARVATGSAPDCPDISGTLAQEGRAIFTGSGNCYACHGSDAHGTAVAPNLTDQTWLDVDGSYAAIAGLVRSGVPHPKQFPAPMPAMGGAQLTSDQVCAVAAYVRGLGG